MKRYDLSCLYCGGKNTITAEIHAPEKLWCTECEADFNLIEVESIIGNWKEYFSDYQKMIQEEERV